MSWLDTDYKQVLIDRLTVIEKAERDPDLQLLIKEMAKRDPVYFIQNWCWTFDPRNLNKGKPVYMPFVPWDKQVEYIRWRQERESKREGGIVEKSRDSGVSWINVCYQLHHWLFIPGFAGAFGSRKEEYVDRIGDPKSLFEKIRIVMKRLPTWMIPMGWDPRKHDSHMKLINPELDSTIAGEAGDNIGRGGRSSIYDIDEAAWLSHPESVDSAVLDNSEVVIYTSTPNGSNNPFAAKRFGGHYSVFTFEWRDDPRRDQEWYDNQKLIRDPVAFAQEVDLDYTASVSGVVCPGEWVRAAVGLELAPSGHHTAGLDISTTGNNRTVLTERWGPVVRDPIMWQGLDSFQSSFRAAERMAEKRIPDLYYDADGVGDGATGSFSAMQNRGFHVHAIHGSATPSETVWELEEKNGDPVTSRDKFYNLRAELWWLIRERLRKTYMHTQGIQEFPESELLSLPNCGDLIAQLSYPTYSYSTSGKILIESKHDMSKRGLSSPDYADSLVYAFCPPRLPSGVTEDYVRSLLGI